MARQEDMRPIQYPLHYEDPGAFGNWDNIDQEAFERAVRAAGIDSGRIDPKESKGLLEPSGDKYGPLEGLLKLPVKTLLEVLGVVGDTGVAMADVPTYAVTGKNLDEIDITENISAGDVVRLITEVASTGGIGAGKSVVKKLGSGTKKAADKSKSLLDDLVADIGEKTITIPVPTGAGAVGGGAKVKIIDIIKGTANLTKNVVKGTKNQITKEGSALRKTLYTLISPVVGKSGNFLPKAPKFPYYKSSGSMMDNLITGTANLPVRVANTPSAIINSRFGNLPAGYSLYRGFKGLGEGSPDDRYGMFGDFGAGITGGLHDYYLNPKSPANKFAIAPSMKAVNAILGLWGDEEVKEKYDKETEESYVRTMLNLAPPVSLDDNTDVINSILPSLKLSDEDRENIDFKTKDKPIEDGSTKKLKFNRDMLK